MFANMASHSVEVTEAEQPIRIEAYEFVPDKAGPGRFRGGVPFRRDYRFLEEEGVLQVRSDRRTFRPYGLYGGQPGQPSLELSRSRIENPEPVPSKLTMTIRKGELFRHEVAGAGGFGDPLERDPAAVAARCPQRAGEPRRGARRLRGRDRGRRRRRGGERAPARRAARRARLDEPAGGVALMAAGRGMRYRVGVDIGGTFTDIVPAR